MSKLFGIIRQGAEYNGLIKVAGVWGEFVRTMRYYVTFITGRGTTRRSFPTIEGEFVRTTRYDIRCVQDVSGR